MKNLSEIAVSEEPWSAVSRCPDSLPHEIPIGFAQIGPLQTKEITVVFCQDKMLSHAFAYHIVSRVIPFWPLTPLAFILAPGANPSFIKESLMLACFGFRIFEFDRHSYKTRKGIRESFKQLDHRTYIETDMHRPFFETKNQIVEKLGGISAHFPVLLIVELDRYMAEDETLNESIFLKELRQFAAEYNMAVLATFSTSNTPSNISPQPQNSICSSNHIGRMLILNKTEDEHLIEVSDTRKNCSSTSSKLTLKSIDEHIYLCDYFTINVEERFKATKFLRFSDSISQLNCIAERIISPICSAEEIHGGVDIRIEAWAKNEFPDKTRFDLIVGCAIAGIDDAKFFQY